MNTASSIAAAAPYTADKAVVMEMLTELFVGIGYGLPRMLACFMIFNLLPRQTLPRRVKMGLLMAYSAFLLPVIQPSLQGLPPFSPLFVVVVMKEAFIGVVIGFMFAPMLWAFHAVGDLIDVQSGASTGAIFNPVSNSQAGPFATLMQNLAIVFIFSSGAFLVMLGLLFKSYQVWPVAQWFPQFGPGLLDWLVTITLNMLQQTIAFATPFLAVLLLVEVGFGLVGKSMPSINVFMYSMPAKFWLSLAITVLILPAMFENATLHLLPNPSMFETIGRALGPK
ncbi:MAG: type III secretion system export apparatus subunit SctT [Rhizobacter sp.]